MGKILQELKLKKKTTPFLRRKILSRYQLHGLDVHF